MRKVFNLTSSKTQRKRLRNDSSAAERLLWQHLKQSRFLGYKFRRQQGIGRYVVDFYCPSLRLAIEIDGDTHCDPQRIRRDQIRQQWIENLRIRVLRFTNHEVLDDLYNVLERLKQVVTTTPDPSSSLGFARDRSEEGRQ